MPIFPPPGRFPDPLTVTPCSKDHALETGCDCGPDVACPHVFRCTKCGRSSHGSTPRASVVRAAPGEVVIEAPPLYYPPDARS